jgi:hypothetical protein
MLFNTSNSELCSLPFFDQTLETLSHVGLMFSQDGYMICVEGIHINSSKSKHSNVITHSTIVQNSKSTQSLPSLADRVTKLIYPAAATTQLWLRSYQPGYAVV